MCAWYADCYQLHRWKQASKWRTSTVFRSIRIPILWWVLELWNEVPSENCAGRGIRQSPSEFLNHLIQGDFRILFDYLCWCSSNVISNFAPSVSSHPSDGDMAICFLLTATTQRVVFNRAIITQICCLSFDSKHSNQLHIVIAY